MRFQKQGRFLFRETESLNRIRCVFRPYKSTISLMDGIGIIVFAAFVLIVIIIVVKKSVRIVQQGTFMIVERVGKYQVSFT